MMYTPSEVTKPPTSSAMAPSSTIPKKLIPLPLEGADYKNHHTQGSNATHIGLHLLLCSIHKHLLLRQAWAEGHRRGSGRWHSYSTQGVTPHGNHLPNQSKVSTYTPQSW